MNNLEEIRSIVSQCQFGDWRFHVGVDVAAISLRSSYHRPYLQVVVDEFDKLTSNPKAWSRRKWFFPNPTTRDAVVQTVFKAVLAFVELEARETFTYKRFAIFDPHHEGLDKRLALSQAERRAA